MSIKQGDYVGPDVFLTPTQLEVIPSEDSSSQQTNATEPLRYPLNRIEKENSDFLKISIIQYKKQIDDIFANRSSFNFQSAEERIGVIKKPIANILLPIPQSIQDSNGVKWGEDSLNPFASRGLGAAIKMQRSEDLNKFIEAARNEALSLATDVSNTGRSLSNLFFGSKIINALGGNTSFQGLIARTTGNVLNPNLELLFNGVTLRSFSFDFDLSPRDQKEAAVITKIIRAFKQNMSAKGGSSGSIEKGLFISSPNVFQIKYQTGTEDHKYLNQFKPMALLNMSVNYTGSGTYATYEDTSPVHYKMNLQFQELDPIYAEDYDTGKGKLGVGY
jgi:hypothetical protein